MWWADQDANTRSPSGENATLVTELLIQGVSLARNMDTGSGADSPSRCEEQDVSFLRSYNQTKGSSPPSRRRWGLKSQEEMLWTARLPGDIGK
mmetsp:Transcript_49740/g.93255  ORF Transcript_49740/g.93255 Transcript_49740/m.93255 type:complete len:93 (-) Transcript_49740:16-294(-)